SWGELIRGLEVALRWIVGGSFVFEAWVALVVRHPIMPNFFAVEGEPDPHWYWVRGHLFDSFLLGDRIQGIVGNANLLGMLLVIALIVFGVRLRVGIVNRLPGEILAARIAWIALAAWLLVRAGSATTFVAAAVAAGVLAIALLMRRQTTPHGRTVVYSVFTALALALVVVVIVGYDRLVAMLGRSEGLTGRDDIWRDVLGRAAEHPILGGGFSSPWVPWDPAFAGWIVDHDITVFQAHNM